MLVADHMDNADSVKAGLAGEPVGNAPLPKTTKFRIL